MMLDSDEEMKEEKNIIPFTGKMVRSGKDLDVFKRAYAVSLLIHKASLEFPKIEQYALADQLRRATKSVCANIAEGFAKQAHSAPEFGRFLSMAQGSVGEIQVWLQYAFDLGYITNSQFNDWESEYASVASMLHKLRLKRLKK